jgi:hypothetical protein
MKKGVEIIPEENYRLRNEDIYQPQQKDFGSKASGSGSIASNTTMETEVSSYSK